MCPWGHCSLLNAVRRERARREIVSFARAREHGGRKDTPDALEEFKYLGHGGGPDHGAGDLRREREHREVSAFGESVGARIERTLAGIPRAKPATPSVLNRSVATDLNVGISLRRERVAGKVRERPVGVPAWPRTPVGAEPTYPGLATSVCRRVLTTSKGVVITALVTPAMREAPSCTGTTCRVSTTACDSSTANGYTDHRARWYSP
jgi:hypothetical protein